MTTTFHRLVQKDVWSVMKYYEEVSGEQLADEFFLYRSRRDGIFILVLRHHHHRRPSFGMKREG